MKLFEITAQFKALERLADEEDLPPDVVADTLEGLEGDFETKATEVAKFILNLESEAKARSDAAKAMAARAARTLKQAERMRHYLLLQMQIMQRTRPINTPLFVIARRNNPAAVQVSDEARVPDEYWRQPAPPPKALDKIAIKKALEKGVEIEGCYLESGERVDIKL